MKKIFLLFILSLFIFSLSAQNRPKARKVHRVKLITIAQEYVDDNNDDKKAVDLLFKFTEQTKIYEEYLNKVSSGSYKHMGLAGQADFEVQNRLSDTQGSSMINVINKTFKAFKNYFEEKSMIFKNETITFQAEMRSGRHGGKGSSQRS